MLTASAEYLIRTPLKELARPADRAGIWQVHRSTLVRASAIATVVRDESGKPHLNLRGRPERSGREPPLRPPVQGDVATLQPARGQ